ncbi:chemotaxis protein [Metasolibacillus meyeri]|uniref:chemotaxis protein n=1 Tax=Metasolibacillus meyeri TaxID=1071052 RepID=UPI000D2FBFDE|nr:chemotaxis protein [Metasolibacillus meyeri]
MSEQISLQKSGEHQEVRDLQRILLEQQDDITEICTVIEQLRMPEQNIYSKDKQQNVAILARMQERQQQRFQHLDQLIFTNRRQLKKGKITDNSVVTYSKEVRKLEAGVRTLRLFCEDVVKMTAVDYTEPNRAGERIYYFDKRSKTLQVEIHALREEIDKK